MASSDAIAAFLTSAHKDRLVRPCRQIVLDVLSIIHRDTFDEKTLISEFELATRSNYSQRADSDSRAALVARDWLQEAIEELPYSLLLYTSLVEVYLHLEFPDLAAGAAYKALLLSDAVRDESDEYHESALASFQQCLASDDALTDIQTQLDKTFQAYIFYLLARSLHQCGCLRSAMTYLRSSAALRSDSTIYQLEQEINAAATKLGHKSVSDDQLDIQAWPDEGHVRREQYPWNTYEPDRLQDLAILNEMMHEVAPLLEVKAVALPALAGEAGAEVVQLGVFAKEDIEPGTAILNEISLLTANNKLQDALCDACSADLPGLNSEAAADVVSCQDCEVVFCTQKCHDQAMEAYHPALCEREVDAIEKDVPPAEAADSLYSLLLLRALAMAETQECHPLELNEIKYIWADFVKHVDHEDHLRTLPFSFNYNIRLPFHMLEKMDIDIYANPKYDVWVFNTLYAKFRGTASARLSGLGGRAIRGPEVCAVHPMWCLANHSCDPNVQWNWGGSITFDVRQSRMTWRRGEETMTKNSPGLKQDEEVLNHYCDLTLPVQERREWARGALGGDCLCERCVWESQP